MLRGLSVRDWIIALGGAIVIVFVVMVLAWSGRHAAAIYRLNRGVGGTMFYDAAGHEWFPRDHRSLGTGVLRDTRQCGDISAAHVFFKGQPNGAADLVNG